MVNHKFPVHRVKHQSGSTLLRIVLLLAVVAASLYGAQELGYVDLGAWVGSNSIPEHSMNSPERHSVDSPVDTTDSEWISVSPESSHTDETPLPGLEEKYKKISSSALVESQKAGEKSTSLEEEFIHVPASDGKPSSGQVADHTRSFIDEFIDEDEEEEEEVSLTPIPATPVNSPFNLASTPLNGVNLNPFFGRGGTYPSQIDFYDGRTNPSIEPDSNQVKKTNEEIAKLRAGTNGPDSAVFSDRAMVVTTPGFMNSVVASRSRASKLLDREKTELESNFNGDEEKDRSGAQKSKGVNSGVIARARTSALQNIASRVSNSKNEVEFLSKDAYELIAFYPGKTDLNQMIRTDKNKNIALAVSKVDFDIDADDKKDPEKLKTIQEKVLSLGHTGEVILGIKGDGYLVDKKGPDFVVIENVFRDLNTNLYFNEFARVGVSESLDPASFVWFPCDPLAKDIEQCAGVVARSKGGDQFDLARIGVKRAKFIKIQDTGTNFHPYNLKDGNTEGFELDGIELLSAQASKKDNKPKP